jgi:hypothetical protein
MAYILANANLDFFLLNPNNVLRTLAEEEIEMLGLAAEVIVVLFYEEPRHLMLGRLRLCGRS